MREYWENFRGADPLLQAISAVALVILLIVVLPYLVPNVLVESPCIDLVGPSITGNNRSVLAIQTDPSYLRLDLSASPTTIATGQSLTLNVRFINASMAPMNLYLIPDSVILRYTGQQETGLQISIRDSSGRVLGEPRSVQPGWVVPPQYTLDQLHVLGPHQQCIEKIEIPAARLTAAGINSGTYQIAAVYNSQGAGQIPPVGRLTPTPIYHDQGVWVGMTQSNTIAFTIGAPR
jgi:hypothetical protein